MDYLVILNAPKEEIGISAIRSRIARMKIQYVRMIEQGKNWYWNKCGVKCWQKIMNEVEK